MYRYSEEDRQIIAAARKRNKDKRAEKRLYALELRAEGKSAEEVSAATGFHIQSKVPYYTVNDRMPLGHGDKSAMIIKQYTTLILITYKAL